MLFLTINVTDNISLGNALLCMGIACILGAVFALFYVFTKKKEGFDRSFIASLTILPIIVAIIIMLVSNDIVKAFSLGGVFVLIRFRTRIKDVKDATFLFSVIGIGFACGLSYYLFAFLIAIFLLIILSIIHLIKLDEKNPNTYRLKVLIPENLDYINLFNNVFEKYLNNYKLKKVKITDFGSLIELTYIIKMKESNNQKAFLDEIRQKNGNLNIIIADDYEEILEACQ